MARSAVALLSGGLDSAVAVALWRADGGEVAACVTADYGQRSAAMEREYAQRLCARWNVPWREVALPWLGEAAQRAGSALMAGGGELPERSVSDPGDAASAAAVWVPARNVVLLAAAAAIAEAEGAAVVLAGFNREEAVTFADNAPPFVAAINDALASGTRTAVRVESPTIDLDKLGLVAAAREHGLSASDVWSCYGGGPEPCAKCESCARSARAWAADS